MNKYKLATIIENFAPLDTQEKWDCSGWQVDLNEREVKKAAIALTVTKDVYNQAMANNCDIIISHHPLFEVPLEFSNINIYSAHTNIDKADGGTTDIFIKTLGLKPCKKSDFLRICDFEISVEEFAKKIKKVSQNTRLINNYNKKNISKIAFCAGSGMDLYNEAVEQGCDCFVTGDIKYHSAVESHIVMFDVGHFDSEILIKKIFQSLIEDNIEVYIANETSPFKNI